MDRYFHFSNLTDMTELYVPCKNYPSLYYARCEIMESGFAAKGDNVVYNGVVRL